VKIRHKGLVNNRAVYMAIGVRWSGHKEILGLWIEQTEGAKLWLRVMTELRNRGTQDILIAVVVGLRGFPEVITLVFPRAVVQTRIVHLIGYSMHFASWKERRPVALALKPIYQAAAATVARERLEDFDRGPWGQKYRDCPKLAAQLGTGDTVLRLCAGAAQNPLQHQCHREP
jgi:putative transposase